MTPPPPTPWRARVDLMTAALLFSTGGAFIKVLTGLTPWQRAGVRSLVAVIFLLAVWRRARSGWSLRSLLFGFFYAGTLATFVAANTYTTSANAIFLQSTAPLYVLLLSPFVLKERVRRSDLLFMVALAAGLGLCFAGELEAGSAADHSANAATAPRPMLGNVLAVVSGLLWGCTIVGLRWFGKRSDGDAGSGGPVILGNLVCFGSCVLLSWCFGEPFFAPLTTLTAGKIGALLFLGCGQVGLAYVVISRGMTRVPAMEASLLLLVEPIFNPLWTFLVHGERPGAWSLAGGAVILAATAIHAMASRPGASRD